MSLEGPQLLLKLELAAGLLVVFAKGIRDREPHRMLVVGLRILLERLGGEEKKLLGVVLTRLVRPLGGLQNISERGSSNLQT